MKFIIKLIACIFLFVFVGCEGCNPSTAMQGTGRSITTETDSDVTKAIKDDDPVGFSVLASKNPSIIAANAEEIIKESKTKILSQLLDNNQIKIAQKDNSGTTLFRTAIDLSPSSLALMIEKKPEEIKNLLWESDNEDENILAQVIKNHNNNALKELLKVPDLDLTKEIKNSPKVTFSSTKDKNLLHVAGEKNNPEAFIELMKKQPELLIKAEKLNGITPLMVAIENFSDEDFIKVLDEAKSMRNYKESLKGLFEDDNISDKKYDKVLETAPELLDDKNKTGYTPFLLAIALNNIDKVKYLSKKYPKVLMQKLIQNKNEWNAAQLAAENGDTDILQYLLDIDLGNKNNFIHSVNTNDDTLAHYAVGADNVSVELLNVLLSKNKDIFNLKNNNQRIPLWNMSNNFGASEDAISFVIENTEESLINECDNKNRSVLIYALIKGSKSFVEALVKNKDKVQLSKECGGVLPINIGFITKKTNWGIERTSPVSDEKFKLLVDALSPNDINAEGKDKFTALNHAIYVVDLDKVKILVDSGKVKPATMSTYPLVQAIREDITPQITESVQGIRYQQQPNVALLPYQMYVNSDYNRRATQARRNQLVDELLKLSNLNLEESFKQAALMHDNDVIQKLVNIDHSLLTLTSDNGTNLAVEYAVNDALTEKYCDFKSFEKNAQAILTNRTKETLELLKTLGVPSEGFSKGILVNDEGQILWKNCSYNTAIGSVRWNYSEVQDKLLELSK